MSVIRLKGHLSKYLGKNVTITFVLVDNLPCFGQFSVIYLSKIQDGRHLTNTFLHLTVC